MIGVILSGMATDGTLGLDAIKADGRITSPRTNRRATTRCHAAASLGFRSLAGERCERPTS